ncbi:MAG TPA: PP2C family protein-serine/threonine phosphatase [Candidatus Acidoferrum sp.]|nr:PP2C family protein-serine/threonine phosphatase [Candidatus Acidoferrum sp.]
MWQRISEGQRVDQLWSQFTADARASYGFYGRDVDWEEIHKLPKWQRPFVIAKQIFVAMLMKLTPARRVLVVIALVLLAFSGFQFQFVQQGTTYTAGFRFELFSALIFLLLLSLELADKVTMKRDLEIAREIQTWLVPSVPPAISGANVAFATRPQNSVAGDYYDAFYPLADGAQGGKLFLVIADVAGKSVPAALLMATFQASLYTIAREGVPLNELVLRLNNYSCAHSLDGRRFTTAVLGEFDPATRRLTYVNAGHNAPVIRRKNGDIERMEASGLPLGVEKQATYEVASIELASGDALIFFTDGVVDASNERGEEFGEERWQAAIRNLPEWNAEESLKFLMRHVDDFVKYTRQFDDITCLVLRCV